MSSNLGRQVDSVQINHVSVQNCIVDVWESNFFEELEKIKDLIAEYNYVSMDTEFPGIVNVPRSRSHDYEYQLVKINVDELKLIQLGITLFNSRGQTPQGTCTWQFNFKFDVDKEKSLRASIKVLREAGINFDMHKTSGIDKNLFGQYFITSGLVFNEDVAWICFQGNQDFGYMYRILANTPIPDSEGEFLDDIKYYFPKLLDVKYMKHEFEELRGGLSRLGDFLSLERIGQQHQAGSDSWLTGLCFFKLANTYLQGKDILENYNLILYGLSPSVNDEAYLDNYTSVTDQLEREDREYQEGNDDYLHSNYQSHPYFYNMAGHGMEYTNEEMVPNYYSGGHILHPSPHIPHMVYGSSMSPNPMHAYAMSPNSMEYMEDGDNQVNMSYPQMSYPQLHMTRQSQSQNNMAGYPNENFYRFE